MNIEEARQIHAEPAAQALWRAGGDPLTVAAVDQIIARKEQARAWATRRVSVLGRSANVTAVILFVAGFWRSASVDDAVNRAILLLIALGIAWFVIIVRYPTEDDPDLTLARRLREALESEAEGLARMRRRIAGGERFALFLRTFGAETKAMTPADVYAAEQDLRNSVLLDDKDPATRRMAWSQQRVVDEAISRLKDDWTLKFQIIEAIAEVYPVVCLGNLHLHQEKRQQLAKLGVDEITLVKSDWFSAFVEIEHAAMLTVMLLDSMTVHITTEVDHLVDRGRPFVVACTPDVGRKLDGDARYQGLLKHPVVRHVVVSDDDISRLRTTLRELSL